MHRRKAAGVSAARLRRQRLQPLHERRAGACQGLFNRPSGARNQLNCARDVDRVGLWALLGLVEHPVRTRKFAGSNPVAQSIRLLRLARGYDRRLDEESRVYRFKLCEVLLSMGGPRRVAVADAVTAYWCEISCTVISFNVTRALARGREFDDAPARANRVCPLGRRRISARHHDLVVEKH